MAAEFLLEIGCEEIPARAMAHAVDELRERFVQFFRDRKLAFDRVEALGTARRFVVHVPSLATRQESRKDLILGPPARIAYNAGHPTSALEGFARKLNVSVESLKRISTERGEYVGLEIEIEGAPSAEILSKGIPEILRSLTFPKTMVWADRDFRFSRPIRWLVAKHGDAVVPFELFGIRSGGRSQGHRILGSNDIEVRSFDGYVSKLEENFVIVSPEKRRRKIERELEAEASRLGARIIGDERLLEEVVYLNEYPTVLLGRFDERFLDLPREVLVTVMKEHQKYFALENARGELMPYFLAVMNTPVDPNGLIRKGHERVLRARLADGMFFWNVDAKHSLEERRARLKTIVFQESLGSYADKVKRMLRLAKTIGRVAKTRVPNDVIEHSVRWSKSDLTTEMVREFTDLQGIVGGLYAKREGAPEDVWRAIYDQYWPQSFEDRVPETTSGAVLSLADRFDTVLGCFSVGLIPTGSEDPLGLRRQLQGAIKILLDHHLDFSFAEVRNTGPKLSKEMAAQLQSFYEDRLRFIFGQRGFAYDEINAVLAAGCDNPTDALKRIEAIHAIRKTADFEAISVAFKRIKNILRQAEKSGESFKGKLSSTGMEPEERSLYESAIASEPKIVKWTRQANYQAVLETMASARPVVDRFFDKILVMHKDSAIRRRRLMLLKRLFDTFLRVADVSEIVTN